MSDWAPRRFWTRTEVVQTEDGFTVHLDGRTIRTPGKSLLNLPTRALATRMAAEWEAQGDRVDPASMPLTRAANSAIEKVAPQREAVIAMLAEYGDTDVTCYRADYPDALVERQRAAWDPLLDWAAATYGALLIPVQGVMYQGQNVGSLERLRAPMNDMSDFQLTGFHDLVTLSGSLVIALATITGHGSAQALWQASRIDEIWQLEAWGPDEEAQALAETRRAAFVQALEFFDLSTA